MHAIVTVVTSSRASILSRRSITTSMLAKKQAVSLPPDGGEGIDNSITAGGLF